MRANGTGTPQSGRRVPVSPTTRGGMALDIDGRLDLGRAGGAALASGGRNLSGTATVDLRYRQPNAAAHRRRGDAVRCQLFDVLLGVKLTGINGRIAARRSNRDRASDRDGRRRHAIGKRAGAGRPGRWFSGSLRITGRNATLLSSDVVTSLMANLGLDLSGPLARSAHCRPHRCDLDGRDHS